MTAAVTDALVGSGPTTRRWSRPRGAEVIAVLVLIAAGAASFFRQEGHHSWQVMWGEDGSVYLQQVQLDGASTLFRGYAGYLQLVPRIGALLVAEVPLRRAAVAMAVAGVVITTAVGILVFRATADMIRSVPLRLLAPLLLVIGPAMGSENTATLTNVIWPLFGAVPFLVLARARGRVDTVVRCGVVALAVLSQALSLLFAPLALVVALKRRDRASIAMAVTYAVAGLLQLAVVVTSPGRPKGTFVVGDAVKLFGLDVVGQLLVGNWHAEMWVRFGVTFALGAMVVFAALLLVAAWRSDLASRRLAAVLVVCGIVAGAAPIISNGTAYYHLFEGAVPTAPYRYIVVPVPLFVAAFAVLLDPLERRLDLVGVIGRWLLVAQTVLFIVIWFPSDSGRGDGPVWPGAVRQARDECGQLPDDATVTIEGSPPQFVVVLPCAVVER